jgi:uncharacterized protein YegP (UPF0339 family)
MKLETYPANKGGFAWRLVDPDDRLVLYGWVEPNEDKAEERIAEVRTMLALPQLNRYVRIDQMGSGGWKWFLYNPGGDIIARSKQYHSHDAAQSEISQIKTHMSITVTKLRKNRILGRGEAA